MIAKERIANAISCRTIVAGFDSTNRLMVKVPEVIQSIVKNDNEFIFNPLKFYHRKSVPIKLQMSKQS